MPFEIEFLPVGESNGDAITIRYGSEYTGFTIHLVDGGYVDTATTIIDHINTYYGRYPRIEHVVLSHADRDHAGGLAEVLETCDVGKLWMNRPWLYVEEIVDRFHGNFTVEGLRKKIREEYDILVQLEMIAERRGISIHESFAGYTIGPFHILAPARHRYLSLIPDFDRTPRSKTEASMGLFSILREAAKEVQNWFESWTDEKLSENPPKTSASNESSIVQLGIIDGRRLLLTADAGPRALEEARDVAEYLGVGGHVNFMQIPHHGSRRNVTPATLNYWLGEPVPEGSSPRGTSFVAVGTNKAEYPRNRVRNAFLRRGFTVCRGTTGWIRHNYGMPNREGATPLESLGFMSFYEE